MDLHSVHKLDNLLSITGPQWFTHQLIKVLNGIPNWDVHSNQPRVSKMSLILQQNMIHLQFQVKHLPSLYQIL